MFSPRELEGEVDHAFFDSEGEEDGHSGVDCEKREESSAAGKPGLEDGAYSTDDTQTECSRTEGSRRAYSPRGTSPLEEEERSRALSSTSSISSLKSGTAGAESPSRVTPPLEEEERSRPTSSVSSLKSELEVKNDTYTGEVTIGTNTFTVSPTEYRDDNDDGYDHSEDEDESEEEEASLRSRRLPLGPQGAGKPDTPRKTIRKQRHRSPSPASSEAESCVSRPQTSSLPSSPYSPLWTPRLGSGRPVERPPVEDSDDSVTDVTPLSTPDVSPITLGPEGRRRERERQDAPDPDRVFSSFPRAKPKSPQDRVPLSSTFTEDPAPDVDEGLLSIDSRLGSVLITRPRGRNRKNYSFTNDEVRHIDHENQRLLRQLSRPAAGRSRPGSPAQPPIKLYHTARNRQREQQRIDRENLAFLRRLESVKPTRGMRRTELLADYQRQAAYLGGPAPLATSYRSTPDPLASYRNSCNTDRLSSRTSSGRSSRPVSSTHHPRSRVSSATPTSPPARSSRTPGTRSPPRASPPRPAWC